jgi:hypothetical protein
MSLFRIASAFRARRWPVALALTGLTLCGCESLPDANAPQTYIDQTTAVTVSVVGRPLIFARERPNFAVHMRDYITLAAATVNRSGKIDYVVIAYFWTTFDPHGQDGDSAARKNSEGNAGGNRRPDDLIIAADDRRIRLVPQERSPHDVGIEEPVHAPSVGTGPPVVYHADPATLRYIAAARHLSAETRTGDIELNYEIWDDRRAALSEWLQHLGD